MADSGPEFGSSEAGGKGGDARAKSLSKAERSEIARKGAETRWQKEGKLKNPVARATHGDADHPLRIGNLEIACYVLEDGTRVLSGRGMQGALNLGQRHGSLLGSFLARKSLKPFIANELAMALENPIRFIRPGRGGVLATGYEATILADICEVVLAARKAGTLTPVEQTVAEQCEMLTRAFAKVGIIALVDEATGYQQDRARDALAKILEAFVAKELQKWISTFRLDYYEQMFRLWKIDYDPQKPTMKRPQFFGTLTNNIVYDRLAPGVKDELRKRNPVNERGQRSAKHFQHLTPDLGHPKLKEHLAAVTALMRASKTKEQFMKMLESALPKYKPAPLYEQRDDDAPRALPPPE